MLNNYVSGLSFPTLLIAVLQATVTHQSGLHMSGDTDWPPAAATWCKEPRANYNYSSIQTKGRNHRIKNKTSAHKKTQNISFKCVQLVLNINFDFQTFLLLISPFCSKCAKSTWSPFALKQTHLGGKSSQCANLFIDFTASVLGSWCYLESPGARWLSVLQICFCW